MKTQKHYGVRCGTFSAVAAVLVLSGLSTSARGQLKAPVERLDEIEPQVVELREELDRLRAEVAARTTKDVASGKEAEDLFANGVLTVGNVKLKLGGRIEILFIDTAAAEFAPLGPDGFTSEPDPHLELNRLRLAPVLEFNRQIHVLSQIDFRPTQGDTVLKELVARFDIDDAFDVWWLGSRVSLGLDDRWIRPNRRTKNYPLIGNAIWRDESLALQWRVRFGDAEGSPLAGKKQHSALDFIENWGEIDVHLSIGQGYLLDSNEVGFDSARYNDIVQDDRELANDLALRELGAGLGYRRSFQELGEIAALGFYFNDEVRDGSIDFLQGSEMTLLDPFDPTLPPLAGYGRARSDGSERWGVSVEYFFPAATVLGDVIDSIRGGDGLRVLAQYISATDGRLDRSGWFVQSSWRFSLGRLLFDRYLRSVEPIVRYGELDVDVPFGRDPTLPGTWDRRELLVGAIVEVTGDVFVKAEYTFRGERTGGGSVDDDELLIELLLNF